VAALKTPSTVAKKSGTREIRLYEPQVLPSPARLDASAGLRRYQFQNSVVSPGAGATNQPLDVTATLHPPAAPPLFKAPLKAAQSNAVTVAQFPSSSAQPVTAGQAGKTSDTIAVESTSAAAAPMAGAPVSQLPENPEEAQQATASKRPAIILDPSASTMKTAVVGGVAGYAPDVTKAKIGGQDVVCSIIPGGVRCQQGKRASELHREDAELKVIASQGRTIWAGGALLLRSDDAGVSWSDVKKPFSEAVSQIVAMADAVYVRTAGGSMWKSADNGATWTQSPDVK
jgi:hypothetical protein